MIAKKKKEDTPRILVPLFLILPVIAESRIGMTCAINDMGQVYFEFPNVTWSAILYYKRQLGSWKSVERDSNKGRFIFLQQDIMYVSHDILVTSFDFMISTKSENNNNKLVNRTDIYFAQSNQRVSPWKTKMHIRMCEGGFGMVYYALYATNTEITVEWFRYPVDEFFKTTEKFIIQIDGGSYVKHTAEFKTNSCDDKVKCNCYRDFCSYKYEDLTPCTIYKVCMSAVNSENAIQTECREIKTYCKGRTREKIIWKEPFIGCFGLMIFVTTSILVYIRYKQHKETTSFDESDIIPPRSQPVISVTYPYTYTDVMSVCEKNYLL